MNNCTSAPDKIFGTYIGDVCYKHDVAYKKGGTDLDRKLADKNLYIGLKERVGLLIAFIYYIGVRLFGGKHWKRKQR